MKIRIKGNSIRLRLTQSEVGQFVQEGIIKEQIQFGLKPNETLEYTLIKGQKEQISAIFENNNIIISVPESLGNEWASTDRIGIENELKLEENRSLQILIEKDFKCLTVRDGEDESDNFPHPKEGSMKC